MLDIRSEIVLGAILHTARQVSRILQSHGCGCVLVSILYAVCLIVWRGISISSPWEMIPPQLASFLCLMSTPSGVCEPSVGGWDR